MLNYTESKVQKQWIKSLYDNKIVFSGDITSLARRFEIPRDALNNIKGIADESERFIALQNTLAQYGITVDLLGAQANATATAYEKLSGNTADVRAELGQLLAELGKPFAETFAASIRKTTTELANLRLFLNQTEQAAIINQKVLSTTAQEGYSAYAAKIAELNAQLPFFAQSIQALTPTQYAYVAALQETGVGLEAAFQRSQGLADQFDLINAALDRGQLVSGASAEQMNALAVAIGETASISAAGAGFVEGLAISVAQGLPIEQAMLALHQFRTAELANLAAQTNANTNEQAAYNEELNAGAIEQLNSQQQTQALKQRQEELFAVIQALINGTITQANAESILANNYGITAGQLPGLIALEYQLAAARRASIEAQNALNQAQVSKAIEANRQAGRIGRGDSSDYAAQDAAARRSNEERQKALEAQILATGSAAEKRDLLNKRLRDAVALYGENSAAAIKATTALQQFDQAQAKASGRKTKAGGTSAPKLTPNEKINTQLLNDLDKYHDKFQDAEQDHYDKLAEIYEDYNAKIQAQMRQNEVSKRRSRADFYSALADADGIDVSKFAAQYEQAFAEAQRLAQEGKAKLSQEFLDLRTQQIEELKQLEEEAAQIRADREEGTIDEAEASRQLEFLEGRRKLIEEAQAEELKQLLEGGDAYLTELNQRLTEEEQRYAEQTENIITSAERAMNAKITTAERNKIAVDAENKSLAAQAQLYDRIAAKNGGVLPEALQQRPTATGSTPVTTSPEVVDVQATSPIPVTPTDVLTVRQAEFFAVRDQDVINTIADMAVRLEGKLDTVVSSVNNATDVISGAVRAVESAVNRVKVNPNAIQG